MFNLAIDSKLRRSNMAHERPLCAMRGPSKAQDNFWMLNLRTRLGSAIGVGNPR